MSSDVKLQSKGKVQNYFLCTAEVRQALKAKAAVMQIETSILIATVLESWLIHWSGKPVSLGEIDKTITP